MKQYKVIVKNVTEENTKYLEVIIESFADLLSKFGFLTASEYSEVDQKYLDEVMLRKAAEKLP